MIKTIDITPTWLTIMPVLIALIETGTETGKLEAKQELMELALKLDEQNRCSHTSKRRKQP